MGREPSTFLILTEIAPTEVLICFVSVATKSSVIEQAKPDTLTTQ